MKTKIKYKLGEMRHNILVSQIRSTKSNCN